MQKKIEFIINFGGFYDTIHGARIDDREPECSITRQELEFEYSQDYINNLNDLYDDDLKLLMVDRPKFYNHGTDVIIASIRPQRYNHLYDEYINDSKFVQYVNDVSQSRQGFHSFYNGIDEVKREPSILMQYIYDYRIENDRDEINDFGF